MATKRVGNMRELPVAERVCPVCGTSRRVTHWTDQWSEVLPTDLPRFRVPESNVLRFEVRRPKDTTRKLSGTGQSIRSSANWAMWTRFCLMLTLRSSLIPVDWG